MPCFFAQAGSFMRDPDMNAYTCYCLPIKLRIDSTAPLALEGGAAGGPLASHQAALTFVLLPDSVQFGD
jgi:hypothetical protein